MKNMNANVMMLLAVLSSFCPAALAADGLEEGGRMVVGKGHGPSEQGTGVSGSCVSPSVIEASTEAAKSYADQDAAKQCRSGSAQRVGEYRIDVRCAVWNSFFPGAFAQAPYVCDYL